LVQRFELEDWLHENTKPGDSVEIRVLRNAVQTTLTATLDEKPIAIIRPESDLVDPNFVYPEHARRALGVDRQDYRSTGRVKV